MQRQASCVASSFRELRCALPPPWSIGACSPGSVAKNAIVWTNLSCQFALEKCWAPRLATRRLVYPKCETMQQTYPEVTESSQRRHLKSTSCCRAIRAGLVLLAGANVLGSSSFATYKSTLVKLTSLSLEQSASARLADKNTYSCAGCTCCMIWMLQCRENTFALTTNPLGVICTHLAGK